MGRTSLPVSSSFEGLRLVAALVVFAAAPLASAQGIDKEALESESPAAFELPVIIVTPEWQPVDAQRVPKTINSFTAEALDAAGIHDTIDLQYIAPGLVFKTNSVLGQPYLRGVGSDFISAGAESSVATFVDGVYLPRAYDSIVDFFDIERVEVIQGPQAVHLGRNVVGGAVSIHTRDPGREPDGYVDLQVGNYDRRRLRAAATIPLEGTPLSVRVAGSAARRDGYTENTFLNTDVNDEDFYALRAKLLYEPRDSVSVVIGAERHREDSSRATGTQPAAGLGVNGGIAMGGIVPADPREITENVVPEVAVESTRYSARVAWTNGAVDLLSTSAYLATEADLALDLDGTNADFASNHPSGTSRTFMQEIRLSSSMERRWSWTGGVFLLDETANQALDVRLPQSGSRSLPDADVDTRSYALFGDVAYRIDAAWRGRVGLRYSQDAREIDLVRDVIGPTGTSTFMQNEGGRWHGTTPEIGIEYSPQEDRLYFASIARGYKAGGFNTSTIQAAFEPEFLTAYETGIKATFPTKRLRVNASLFYYDYEDLQLNTPPTDAPVGTFPRVINAAKSSIRGADIEIVFQPDVGNLRLSVNAALLDAEFDEFVSIDPNNPGVDPDRAGNRMPQAPEATLNARADHVWSVARGSLTLSGEYRRQSDVYFNIYQDPALRQKSYGEVNASLTFEHAGDRWYAELFGRNLTDELYAQTILRNDPLGGTKRLWAAPRSFGLRVGYRW